MNVVDGPCDFVGTSGDDLAGIDAECGRQGRHGGKYTPEVFGLLGRFSRENAPNAP